MAGVLFVICVPTEIYENNLKKSQINLTKIIDKCSDNKNVKICLESPKLCTLLTEKPVENQSNIPQVNLNLINLETDNPAENLENCSENNNLEENVDDFDLTIETVLRKILRESKIKNAVWTKGESGNYLQVIFPLESGTQCENILAILRDYGIGQRLNSVVSVIPCSLYYKDSEDSDTFILNEDELDQKIKREQAKDSTWHRFVTSVRARLTVAQVVESVKAQAALTFDFLVLLIIATILSAIALAENNNVYLVSSMLISPMMGPVMAGTFGSVIQDKKLQKMGVFNELIGVGVAAVVGFGYGVIITGINDKYGEGDWPTYEMTSRGEMRTLWVGCLIALLSGAAVALGILGDNIGSLVGVAISASLMPPAVNAGLLWGMAAVYAAAGEHSSKSIVRTHYYSSNDVLELAALGGISMCLTFGNIVCIYLAGILVFKVKEVAPSSSKDKSRTFWKYDIKIARDYNRTIQCDEAHLISKHLSNELSNEKHQSLHEQIQQIKDHKSRRTLQEFTDHLYQSTEVETTREHVLDVGKMQHTWSPSTFAPKKPTIQELKNLYFSLIEKKPKAQKNMSYRTQHFEPFPTGLPSIPEDTHSAINITPKCSPKFRNPKKFVVTPATIEN